MPIWLDALTRLSQAGETGVLITRLGEGGGRIVVCAATVSGHFPPDLQDDAVRMARAMLHDENSEPRRAMCGGEALLFEPVAPVRFRVAVFGAGPIGRALIRLLGDLPCAVEWFDADAGAFPSMFPDNVRLHPLDRPMHAVDALAAGTHLAIMTHDHPLDFVLTELALQRPDLGLVLLAGSRGKRATFDARLEDAGLTDLAAERLLCPVGSALGRLPAEIAVVFAARLLEHVGAREAASLVRA